MGVESKVEFGRVQYCVACDQRLETVKFDGEWIRSSHECPKSVEAGRKGAHSSDYNHGEGKRPYWLRLHEGTEILSGYAT